MATGPKETARGEGGGEKSAPRYVLPAIPTAAELQEAIARMTPSESQQAFRHRVLPIAWEPGRVAYVAAGERAKTYAAGQGLTVSAVTNERTLLRELQRGRESELIYQAASGLKERFPQHSAAQGFTADQALWLVFGIGLIAFAAMWDRPTAEVAGFSVMLAVLALVAALDIWCLLPARLPKAPPLNAIPDDGLPVYTVLVPLLREARLAERVVSVLGTLDYPKAKLDIKLVLEEGDRATLKAFEDMRLPSHVEIIMVPRRAPETRHKALNYALTFARGDLLAVYHADDMPPADQLRRVAGAFALAPKTAVCLQSQVVFYNRHENWLTRQSAIEQAVRFKLLFPRLARFGAPLISGGAACHYRVAVLRQLGGFDSHNLAPDSGLTVRLARFGYRTALFPMLTRSEAPCRHKEWMARRVRAIKGALQTALVNTRTPFRMWRELGSRNFLLTQALTGGAIIVALLHPVFLVWFALAFTLGAIGQPVTGRLWLFLLALYGLVAVLAGLAALAISVRAALALGRGFGWAMALATLPVYWLMISLATWIAVLQFFTKSRRWSKTAHGVSRVKPQSAQAGKAAPSPSPSPPTSKPEMKPAG
ncbi:glycosyltransferase [Nordella sp. HKS 07]|uniref:glycosyltransferase n=1 Tax=Nordella sp. HKS 07 TaxID=2712222 RepID=UPI0013E1D416|nr:glycosyltransferase [Nordella sp. HKS 07]QIG48893.1 glycosyltransferase [Nordella sp. HKS 07]